MLMAIDVGNTNMVFGLFRQKELVGSFRLGTDPCRTADEIGLLVWDYFRRFGWDAGEVEDVAVASVRAYREGRHGSEKWANRAAFSEATDLFRFRCIPGVKVTSAMVIRCGNTRFNITSVEDVKGRGMYLEVLAKEVTASG